MSSTITPQRPKAGSRKRTRDEARSNTWSARHDIHAYSNPVTPLTDSIKILGDDRYVVAGQEAPKDGILDAEAYADLNFRTNLGAPASSRVHLPRTADASISTTNGSGGSPRSAGWGSSAMYTLGGVVGKVWNFCTTGAFNGFRAGGGGQVYGVVEQGEAQRSWTHLPNTPGQFPESDYMPYLTDIHEATSPQQEIRPTAKRRQVSAYGGDGEDLGRSWVMVTESEQDQQSRHGPQIATRPSLMSRASSTSARQLLLTPNSTRRSTGRSIPTPTRPFGRHSLTSPMTNLANHPVPESASYASARSRSGSPAPPPAFNGSRIPQPMSHTPSLAASRPSSRQSLAPTTMPARRTSLSGSGHRRNHSLASTATTSTRRKTELSFHEIDASPRLDDEAKRLATRKIAVDKKTHARIDTLNATIEDLIRGGKEALRTQVEVNFDDDDDDWNEN